jgi:hypothetical protein
MEILLFWLLFCVPLSVAVAILAGRYNRSAGAWFVLSVLFSPIIGFAFVLAMGPLSAGHVQAGYQPRTGESAPDNPPNQGSSVTYAGSRFRPPL